MRLANRVQNDAQGINKAKRMQQGKRINVAIADDDFMVRQAMRRYLENFPDLAWAGEAEDAAGALQLVATGAVDVLLLDISMPGANGTSVVRSMRDANTKVRILVLSGHPAAEMEAQALHAGAHAYIGKTTGPAAIVQAIREAGQAVGVPAT